MQALGEFIELSSMALAAGGRDVLKIYHTMGIARTEHAGMSLILPKCAGIASMAFVASHPMLLVYRSLPTVGLYTHETADLKLGMAIDTGIPGFIFIIPFRSRGEQEG